MRIKPENLKELFLAEVEAVDDAVQRAAEYALLVHKRAGCPVSSWEDGKIIITPPEKIRVNGQPRKKSV